MVTQLRCKGDLYGIISDDGTTIEVTCKRRKCGYAGPGTVVLHKLSLITGEEIDTKIFRNPPKRKA